MNVTRITPQNNCAKTKNQSNTSFKAAVLVKYPKSNTCSCPWVLEGEALRFAIRIKNAIPKEGTIHMSGPFDKSYLIVNGSEKEELQSVVHKYDESLLNLDTIFGKIINKIKNKKSTTIETNKELQKIQEVDPINLLKKSEPQSELEAKIKKKLEEKVLEKVQKNEYLAKAFEITKRDTTPVLTDIE